MGTAVKKLIFTLAQKSSKKLLIRFLAGFLF